jgi:amino acid transporter/nucleotide-binding universal stress UspA family protein
VAGISIGGHRPRNVDWKRAAALLYGDWGTSKAYVIGLAFVSAQFASLPIILAVCAVTGLVGLNYAVICRYFPDGGGVYSSARVQGRLLAVIGALLLVADLTVTAALSGYSALSYVSTPFLSAHIVPATIVMLAVMAFINFFGPKHSGSFAVMLAAPTMIVVVILILFAAPHFTTVHLENPLTKPGAHFSHLWVQFVDVILALSGVEAIANLTGVMKLDKGSTYDEPKVGREAGKAIFPVGFEVVVGTALLGWAMLSLPHSMTDQLLARKDDMLRFLGETYGTLAFGPVFGNILGWIVGIVFFLLLLSAANTAIVAMIGLLYMMASDGEMPGSLKKLNGHGVPMIPLIAALVLPVVVLICSPGLEALAGLYAIGVVGAVTVNLGSCAFNKKLPVRWWERGLFMGTFVILFCVEITLAKTKPDALFFVLCVLGIGLAMRAYTMKSSGMTSVTVSKEVADIVSPESIEQLRPHLEEGQKIMVAARGVTPVLRFALEEAELRKATLCVLYVKEIAVFFPGQIAPMGKGRWQDDPHASAIMSLVLKMGEEKGVSVLPVYAVSEDPPATILDLAATLGVDYLLLGASHRLSMTKLLKGNVVVRVASELPEDIQLIIHG